MSIKGKLYALGTRGLSPGASRDKTRVQLDDPRCTRTISSQCARRNHGACAKKYCPCPCHQGGKF